MINSLAIYLAVTHLERKREKLNSNLIMVLHSLNNEHINIFYLLKRLALRITIDFLYYISCDFHFIWFITSFELYLFVIYKSTVKADKNIHYPWIHMQISRDGLKTKTIEMNTNETFYVQKNKNHWKYNFCIE